MPVIYDWINNPLEIVQNIFDQDPGGEWKTKISQYFNTKLNNEGLKKICDLNTTPNFLLHNGQLVKFRCMIQDMYNPEFYCEKYKVTNLSNGQLKECTGMYRDVADVKEGREELAVDFDESKISERQILYCITVPAENEWTKIDSPPKSPPVLPSISTSPSSLQGQKRSSEDEAQQGLSTMSMEDNTETKKTCTETPSESQSQPSTTCNRQSVINLNFPIPGMKGSACIVKVYGTDDNFSLNEVVEFVGVVSVHPALAENNKNAVEEGFLDQAEATAHDPPPSLIPRLHVLSYKKIVHSNPILPQELHNNAQEDVDILKLNASNICSELLAILTQSLLGDEVAAQYLLCHLVSTIYLRNETLALGKYSLNLCKTPLEGQYTKRLYDMLSKLVAKSFYQPMSLDNMNNITYVPKKDYVANRLVSGLLQLSDKTHLILDETALSTGQLDANGVRNIAALECVIKWQKVDYDFNYHHLEYPCNIPVIVMSEGRSLLNCDVQIPMVPTKEVNASEIEAIFNSIDANLNDTLLHNIRCLITIAQNAKYNVNEDIQKIVENDFVAIRRDSNAEDRMTADDLHSLLVLARLLSVSACRDSLTEESWAKAKVLEVVRKTRLKALPPRNTPRVL